jgi:hypothetical protein
MNEKGVAKCSATKNWKGPLFVAGLYFLDRPVYTKENPL